MTATINYFAFPGTKYIYIPMPNLTPEIINEVIIRNYDVSLSDMAGKIRKREMVRLRQAAMYLLKKNTDLTLKDIGMAYGGRDHSTVIHARKAVRNALQGYCDDIKTVYLELEQSVMYEYLKMTKFEDNQIQE